MDPDLFSAKATAQPKITESLADRPSLKKLGDGELAECLAGKVLE
jgi:hypothetical protein